MIKQMYLNIAACSWLIANVEKKQEKKGERGRKKQQGTGKIYKRSWNPMNSPFEAFDLRLESNKEEQKIQEWKKPLIYLI